MEYQLIQTSSEDIFVTKAVEWLSEKIVHALNGHESCTIGLSGGTTPRNILASLGEKSIDWEKLSIFLTDERYAPADHEESNQRMIRETLLAHASIPESQILIPDTSLPLPDCIVAYEQRLTRLRTKPADVVILGMGDDGHIASLFPPLNEAAFGPNSVIPTVTDHFAVRERISVTFPILESALSHLLLLKGEAKRKVWEEMLASPENEYRWPAKRILMTGRTLVIACW